MYVCVCVCVYIYACIQIYNIIYNNIIYIINFILFVSSTKIKLHMGRFFYCFILEHA